MSTTTLAFKFVVDGSPADAASVVLRDPSAAYGVRRTDTNATVVAAGTAMAHDGVGLYSHTFTDPAAGLAYQYWVEVVYDGATYRFERNRSAAAVVSAASRSYLAVDEADELAAALPGLAAWAAADAGAKSAALEQASYEVDNAMPYQGRRYAAGQAVQFPRVAYESSAMAGAAPLLAPAGPPAPGPAVVHDLVWDWDAESAAAVAPRDVKLAALHQADSILSGARQGRLDNQHDGVVYDLTGTLAESYKLNSGPGVTTGLCRAAWVLMRKYRLRGGRLL